MLNDQINYDIDLVKAILGPIVFFDLFEYPLTAFEIWNYLEKNIALEKIYFILEQLVASSNLINEKNGFYFLVGREEIVTIRQKRYNYSCTKIKIAKKFSYLFSLMPFVKVVAVANFIGDHNLKEEGDIDFFIITASRRIWLSRLFCTGLAKLLNRRPTAQKKKDRICLSFYVSEDHLNIFDLASFDQTIYLYYYLRGLMPIYNQNNIYSRFLIVNHVLSGNVVTDYSRHWLMIDWLEILAKNFQLKIMPLNLRQAINNSEGVYVSDSVLKFHLNDKRRYFTEKFNYNFNAILQKIN
jgi:hypothetical protein